MQCSEVMNRDVQVIAANESTAKAAEIMQKHDIGFIPVCDSNRKN
jgi:CBS-domain-containing membrane protein